MIKRKTLRKNTKSHRSDVQALMARTEKLLRRIPVEMAKTKTAFNASWRREESFITRDVRMKARIEEALRMVENTQSYQEKLFVQVGDLCDALAVRLSDIEKGVAA
jgi:hypothetical protein